MFSSWLPYSLIATSCFGVYAALLKLPSMKGHSKIAGAFWIVFTQILLSIAFFHSHLQSPSRLVIILASLFGVAFAMTVTLQMRTLSHVDTNTLFPISTTLSLMLSVGVGLLAFSERLSPLQMFGILLAIISIYLFSRHKTNARISLQVAGLILLVASFSATGKIVQKIAADNVDVFEFQIYQYVVSAAFLFLMYALFNRGKVRELFSGVAYWSTIGGAFSFFGGWALLLALTKGPFMLVTSIHSTYVIITALFGWALFGEKLGPRKIFLIFLAVVAVMLMRNG